MVGTVPQPSRARIITLSSPIDSDVVVRTPGSEASESSDWAVWDDPPAPPGGPAPGQCMNGMRSAIAQGAPRALYGSRACDKTAAEHLDHIENAIYRSERTIPRDLSRSRSKSACNRFVDRILAARPSSFPTNAFRYRKRFRYYLLPHALRALEQCARIVQRWWRGRALSPRGRPGSRIIVNDVDPFTLDPVAPFALPGAPPHSVVYAGAGGGLPSGRVYCFRAQELVDYIMSSGRALNPFTREILPQQTLFDAAVATARRGGEQWAKLQALARSVNSEIRASSLLELVAREVRRRESERQNRSAATQVLEDNVRSLAETVVNAIFRVNDVTRPFRVSDPRERAEMERLPQLGPLSRPEPATPPPPARGPATRRFREFYGSRSPMTPGAWSLAGADDWAEDWLRMDRALAAAGISQEQFNHGLRSMISGFSYLRQVSHPRYARVIRALVAWLCFILRSGTVSIGGVAREIARRVTWVVIARGLPLVVPRSEVQPAVHFNENEVHDTEGGSRAAIGERLLDTLLSASIVFR